VLPVVVDVLSAVVAADPVVSDPAVSNMQSPMQCAESRLQATSVALAVKLKMNA
jgi:hypothetical protein